MAVLYKHIRKDTNEVFYIGIGKTIARAKTHSDRNKHWYNIVNKVGFVYEVVESNLSRESACIKEKELIKFYGRRDLGLGTLVNMTDGGDGIENPSKETVEKIKNKRKLQIFSNETKLKMSESAKRSMTPEHRKTLSQIKLGKQLSQTHRYNIGECQRDKNVYKFINKNGDEVNATRKFMYDIHNISSSNLSKLINGRLKSIYGWRLIK